MKAINRKSLIIFLFAIVYANCLKAQQLPLRSVIELKLNSNYKKITKEYAKSAKLLKLKGSIIKADYGETFEIQGMFVQLNGAIGEFKNDRLDEFKETLYEMDHLIKPEIYSSKIVPYNNYKVLIINSEYESDEVGKYLIYCLSNDLTKVLSGRLEYQKGERAKPAPQEIDVLAAVARKE